MKAVFFDIDGTLIYCHKLGRKSFGEAIQNICNKPGLPENYSLSGKTDRQILLEVLSDYGFTQKEIDSLTISVFEEYYKVLKRNLARNSFEKVVLPGILNILDELSVMKEEILLGLVTGNLKETALVKLEYFNIQNYFIKGKSLFGGFGSDHVSRSGILDIAVERAEQFTGLKFKGKDIVVIGDSNNDILCGKHLNVKSIGVATGEWSMEKLKEFKPDYLFADFSDYDSVLKVILD